MFAISTLVMKKLWWSCRSYQN